MKNSIIGPQMHIAKWLIFLSFTIKEFIIMIRTIKVITYINLIPAHL